MALLLDYGINQKNIDKYIRKDFNLIENEGARKQAKERCKSLETYFVEKLTLLEQTKNKSNPAGFLVAALKNDYSSPEVKRRVEAELIKAKNHDRLKKISTIQHQIDVLGKEQATLYKALMKHVLEHVKDFNTIYQMARKKATGPFAKVFNDKISPEQNYANGGFVSASINIELRKLHPELFTEIDASHERLSKLESDLRKLQQLY